MDFEQFSRQYSATRENVSCIVFCMSKTSSTMKQLVIVSKKTFTQNYISVAEVFCMSCHVSNLSHHICQCIVKSVLSSFQTRYSYIYSKIQVDACVTCFLFFSQYIVSIQRAPLQFISCLKHKELVSLYMQAVQLPN